MAALMAKDPDAGAEETLNEAVEHPDCATEDGILNERDKVEGSPAKAKGHGEIPEDVVHGGNH